MKCCHAAPERIVYVSCCPETLRRDVDILRKTGYALQSAQAVDLFPYTAHTEAVVLLSKASDGRQAVTAEERLR